MFEIESFICVKMDLAWNNLQWLIWHKTKPNQTKQNRTFLKSQMPFWYVLPRIKVVYQLRVLTFPARFICSDSNLMRKKKERPLSTFQEIRCTFIVWPEETQTLLHFPNLTFCSVYDVAEEEPTPLEAAGTIYCICDWYYLVSKWAVGDNYCSKIQAFFLFKYVCE